MALSGGVLFAVVLTTASPAVAATFESNDFNSPGDLAAGFTAYIDSGAVTQSANGGISDTGAINAPGSADAVFTSKAGYSMGPVGSTYTFSSFLQSVGNSGYSGMGFTSLTASAATASGSPYRPNDALGISVHGGGFVFHNGAADYNGSWDSTADPGITAITPASIFDLLNNGSPDQWYKIVLVITRDTVATFDMRVEVWPSSSAGALLYSSASAVFELQDSTNATILAAPVIHSYINFSGDRVRYFDDYNVELAGGASVIAPGAPVVLTSSATGSGAVASLTGAVTDDGDDIVTARGFAYSLTPAPTVANSVVAGGAGVGAYSGSTPVLASGTYYVRAFATNSLGTSYGSELTVTIAAAAAAAAAAALADSGLPSGLITALGAGGVAAIALGFVMVTTRRRGARTSR